MMLCTPWVWLGSQPPHGRSPLHACLPFACARREPRAKPCLASPSAAAPQVITAPRPGKKCLVLDIDYTLFDLGSTAERPEVRPPLRPRPPPRGAICSSCGGAPCVHVNGRRTGCRRIPPIVTHRVPPACRCLPASLVACLAPRTRLRAHRTATRTHACVDPAWQPLCNHAAWHAHACTCVLSCAAPPFPPKQNLKHNPNWQELARPFLHEFLTACYEFYDIIIWSATSMKWVEVKMKVRLAGACMVARRRARVPADVRVHGGTPGARAPRQSRTG